jgi:hypothetical protein
MKKVKALNAIHEGDSVHKEGSKFTLTSAVADDLASDGLVEVIEDFGLSEDEVKAAVVADFAGPDTKSKTKK